MIIITVVKDNLQALKKTYASLVSQTRQDFRWLVQEGQSTDGTLEWLKSLDYPNLELHSERDKSIHNAMNLAIRKVASGHCMFLNAGDAYYSNDVLERIAKAMGKGDVPFAYGKYIIGSVPGFPERSLGERIHGPWQVFRGRVPCHQTMVIDRAVFDTFGFYDESLGIFSDRDWILGYVKRPEWARSVYLDFPVVHYDPVGQSYHRFLSKWRLYLSMLRKRGNPAEILVGAFGWARTAGYITLSMLLERFKGVSPNGN
ncbi:MAG: glycosyltransferase [Fibrobacterota bacterium]|nr:glycosyltransferase [Fibrobacterota bacterium]